MNTLKILKSSILSTAFLTIVIIIALSFTLVVFPLSYYQTVKEQYAYDIDIYSEEIANYSTISFGNYDNNTYQELSKTFDMENFAGTVSYGSIKYKLNPYMEADTYLFSFASEKMVNELPSRGYNFSKIKPKNYREAYAPPNLRNEYKVGNIYEISCYEGDSKYEQRIKILGYCNKPYYKFSTAITNSFLSDMSFSFLIYDDIPPFAEVEDGLMMSDKQPNYYINLGANAKTVRQMNEEQKQSSYGNVFLDWCICAIVLLAIVVAANYYFAADKLIKRSGVMYIYGGKRSSIIFVEVIKMLLVFILAVIISAVTIGIVIAEIGEAYAIVNWITYFICAGILFAVYIASLSFGFIKFVKFKPLKSLSNDNVE